jgi:hypothetical protein
MGNRLKPDRPTQYADVGPPVAGVPYGLTVSMAVGFSERFGDQFGLGWPVIRFTGAVPGSLAATIETAALFGVLGCLTDRSIAGLTWRAGDESSTTE